MDQLTKDTFPSQPTQSTVKTKRTKRKRILCNECNQKKLDVNNQVCLNCYKTKTIYKPSGNKVIDDFIKYTLFNDTQLGFDLRRLGTEKSLILFQDHFEV